MPSFSTNLSALAVFSSLIMSKLFPACFSCSPILNLLHLDQKIEKMFWRDICFCEMMNTRSGNHYT